MARRLSIWTLATLAVTALGIRSASADGLPTFTGNVANDFPIAPNNGVVEIVDHPMANGQSNPQHVAQASWITQQGWTTGFEMKDMRLMYDAKTDTLAVGLNYFGIAGNGSGNGNPNVTDPRVTAAGGVDPAHLGGDKSISVVIDPTNSGNPAIIAGVPADKTHAGPGIDGFTAAQYQSSGGGWAYSYGKALPQFTGNLAFDPSAAHPGFEFTIPNFSKIPGMDLSKGFSIGEFSGSQYLIVAGKDIMPLTHVIFPTSAAEIITPEPATLLSWSLGLGAAGLWSRRRRRSRAAAVSAA